MLCSTHTHSKCKIQTFHKMLQQTLKNRKLNEKKSTPKISPDSAISCEQSDVLSEEMSIKDGSPEDYTDLNSADLKAMLENIYSSALEPSGSVLQAAKKIVKNVSHFFQKENSSSYEDNVKQFVKDNFFSTVLKIHQKYDTCENEESANKRIKEYQMQALLALELEALFKSSDEASCVKIVTSFLRAMSFYSGASELNKLLFELLKENYSHNLYNILVNIGDELDIPIVGDAESPDSMDDIASLTSIPDPELSSGLSLTFSEASSTSTSYRKLIRRRSDISDTKSSRQILLPGTSPKKKKVKSSAIQKKAVRFSPRLAVKKKKDKSKCVQDKSQTVRRNLFPKETQPQTPKKNRYSSNLSRSKKLPTTPKGKHSLKASFVAETPSHKQNFSALQRRKASMEVKSSQREVAESPQISKIPKDSAKLALLKKLKVTSPSTNKNIIATKNSELALGNFILRSPETKRRLSLKLFSKLLSSPTARMGIKKCSKRLFDDVSPHSSGMPNKKPKLFYECNK
ncbi:uncharacterized protein LOC118186665 isoform X2 [Stegodyphus dumicola]|uniref:uncharacterized protein LOC118186665 isoform X2 n=1 Tax=Stegodyphus dumicola TaxID=202533 RepID=UPI0015AA9958|nr:uncharacterized protein LOC118186665 isoform X2 [Stegodyphus dumicola]